MNKHNFIEQTSYWKYECTKMKLRFTLNQYLKWLAHISQGWIIFPSFSYTSKQIAPDTDYSSKRSYL